MTKQQTRRAIIEYKTAKPFVDALALGLGSSAFAVVFQGPAFNWACIGAGFSLVFYWGSANLTSPKKTKPKRGRAGPGHVVVNSVNGTRKVPLEGGFEYAPRFVSRETWGETLRRFVMGRPEPRPAFDQPAKPKWMTEYIFLSHYDGQEVQLLESDVTRFLNSAWRYRKWGHGLSERRWVRDISQRPQWYKNVGSTWYYALVELLWEVEAISGRQLIVPVGWQQNALARDPHQTLEALKWAQTLKGNKPVQDIRPYKL
jgi:hypothetical protein